MKSALGRIRSFVTVNDFSSLATCYAELSGRVRPKAVVNVTFVLDNCRLLRTLKWLGDKARIFFLFCSLSLEVFNPATSEHDSMPYAR